MSYFIAGFLLGLATSWFWLHQLGPRREFSQLLRRELELDGGPVRAEQAGRMDHLEERFHRLEKRLAGTEGEKGLRGTLPVKTDAPGQKRERALALWKEGRELSEIIRKTGLSRGEVELILSLQEYH